MTDSSSLITTHSISYSNPVTASSNLASPLPNGSLSDNNNQDEEEYTIKCICIYADDDGNTVYCPKCDTWQHIECYYHGKKVPEEHFCADCSPRDLDAKRATERQRRHREGNLEGGDRKVKRPSSKGQKKKHKESSVSLEQMNGWHDHSDSLANGRDHPPPAKKPKTNHRPSGSVVSVNGESRKRASSNVQSYPSPSKSPQDLFRFPTVPLYTTEFLQLYENDEGNDHAHGNEYTVSVLNQLSAWRNNSSLVVSGAGLQPNRDTPFVRLDRNFDQVEWPEVSLERTQKTDTEYDGRYPTWRYLRLRTPLKKDDLVGEIRGQVGMLEEYCQQRFSSNRWPDLAHPDPFVFFHPHMNIYIDSRKAGTQFRYLRRSCKPNVTLKTFISDDGETHHCFVASKDIQAGVELTAAWFLDPSMFPSDDLSREDSDLQNRQFNWVSRVLANFGDCACNGGQACLLARFDRRQSSKPGDMPSKAGRKKKTKNKHAISPLSTGQATNSRAGSETLKGQDDEDQFDHRSTSESSRSGVRSRDLTPINVAALDADPVLGSALTARELRKIQAAERAFEKNQQGVQGPLKKKKRTSGGSTLTTPNVNSSKQLGHFTTSQPSTPSGGVQGQHDSDQYAGSPPPHKPHTVRQKSVDISSRNLQSKVSPVAPPRPVYRSVSIQTDPEECDMILPPLKRRKFSTPMQRLLRKVLADRARADPPVDIETTSYTVPIPDKSSSSTTDIEMKDVGSGPSPVSLKSFNEKSPSSSPSLNHQVGPFGSPSYPLPSQAAHSHKTFKAPPALAPRLQLSNLPPVPQFPINPPVTTPSSTANTPTPLITPNPVLSPLTTTTIAAPFPTLSAGAVTPSPAKKKLSLGDYMSRRLAATPSTEKSLAQVLASSEGDGDKELEKGRTSSASFAANMRPDESVLQEAAARGGLEGSAVDDTPMKDEPAESDHTPHTILANVGPTSASALPPTESLSTGESEVKEGS